MCLAPLFRSNASNLRLAQFKGSKFTAHALCHVTCRQEVKNDDILEIPVAILPIHYYGLTNTIRNLYSLVNFYTVAYYPKIYVDLHVLGPIFDFREFLKK